MTVQPLVSTALYDLAVLVGMVAPVGALTVWALVEAFRFRREKRAQR